jgi:hypothetical protein
VLADKVKNGTHFLPNHNNVQDTPNYTQTHAEYNTNKEHVVPFSPQRHQAQGYPNTHPLRNITLKNNQKGQHAAQNRHKEEGYLHITQDAADKRIQWNTHPRRPNWTR